MEADTNFSFEGISFFYKESRIHIDTKSDSLDIISIEAIDILKHKDSVNYLSSSNYEELTFVKLKRKSLSGSCSEVILAFSPLEICKDEKWRIYRWQNSLSVIGEKVLIEGIPRIQESTICGSVAVKENSTVYNSLISAQTLETEVGLTIDLSEIYNSKIKKSEKSSAISSNITRSKFYTTEFHGTIDSLDTRMNDGLFNVEGDVKCRDGECFYMHDSCGNLGESQKIYNSTAMIHNGANHPVWNDSSYATLLHPKSNYECKVVDNNRVNYFIKRSDNTYQDLAIAPPLGSNWINPLIEKVGCLFDGKVSKTLFRFSIDGPIFPLDFSGSEFGTVKMFCNEEDVKEGGHLADIVVTSSIIPNVDINHPEYFSFHSYPLCYNFKPYLIHENSARALPDIQIDYEDCSDCPIGMIKIGGICTCPEGTVEKGGSCERELDKCYLGLCKCSATEKPYRVPSIGDHSSYTCSPPLHDYSYFDYPLEASNLSASLVVEPCVDGEGKIRVTITKDNNDLVAIYFYCNKRVSPNYSGQGGYVSNEMKLMSSHTGEVTFNYGNSLNCYDYSINIVKMVGVPKTLWKKNVAFSYPHCPIQQSFIRDVL